ncbi:MAG: hypothetical protein WB767_14710 [Nocardioides sp.]
MPRSFRAPAPVVARAAVQVVKCAVMSSLALMAVASTSTSGTTTTADAGLAGDAAPTHGHARLERLMTKHDCSTTGFGADVLPGSALVRRSNHVEHVSFDDGWAVFTGDAPGALLAVCRVNV